jgi:hypothetical protein
MKRSVLSQYPEHDSLSHQPSETRPSNPKRTNPLRPLSAFDPEDTDDGNGLFIISHEYYAIAPCILGW